jgi:hypothetical protein
MNESWYGGDCPACNEFMVCDDCPLAGPGGDDRERCCHGLWNSMDCCHTWAEFWPAMDAVIAFIRAKRDEAQAGKDCNDATAQV